MAKRKLSRDQKRKQKLAKRARQGRAPVTPYTGNKYKNEKYVDVIFRAEQAILECYLLTDKALTDHQVRRSLEELVRELRGEKATPPPGNPVVEDDAGDVADLVGSRIKEHWRDLFAGRPRPAPSDLAGVLRTILGSVDVWSRPTADSRGYLHYIQGFLGKMGVDVQALPGAASGEAGADDEDEPSDEEVLTDLGETWLESGDPADWREFAAEADILLEAGQAGLVIEVCQGLIGQTSDPVAIKELETVVIKAWRQEPPDLPGPRGGGGRFLPGS